MQIVNTRMPDVKLITPRKLDDDRGFFAEVYNKAAFREAGIDLEFVQDNHSLSRERGVIRGLHFQRNPYAQAKLVRVLRGAVFDVALDLRRGSPTYGQHVTAILSADSFDQLLVPVGFAHGFCTLESNTEVFYKVTTHYAPDHDAGVLWNDPALGIEWPVAPQDALLSEKDRCQPRFDELTAGFELVK